jgi:hypothetical protein
MAELGWELEDIEGKMAEQKEKHKQFDTKKSADARGDGRREIH